MYIVGIDIGKNHHEASIVSPEGKQIGHSLRFATTHKGADSLMSFIFNNIGNIISGVKCHYIFVFTYITHTDSIPPSLSQF